MPMQFDTRPDKANWLRAAGRMLLYATVTAVITLTLAFALSASSNKQAIDLLRETRNAARAQACVLSLPVDPNVGRDAVLVKRCFTSNGVTPPNLNP